MNKSKNQMYVKMPQYQNKFFVDELLCKIHDMLKKA